MHPDKKKEIEYELRHEDDVMAKQANMPKLVGMYFYNVPEGQEEKAHSLNIKQTSSGKWAMKQYDKSGHSFNFRKRIADETFGDGKWYEVGGASSSPKQSSNKMTGMFFYNVPEGHEAEAKKLNLSQLKSGKWAMIKHENSDDTFNFRKNIADETFGKGKWWTPPTNEDAMMPQQNMQQKPQGNQAQQGTITNINGDKATITTKTGDTQTTTTTPVSSLVRNSDGTLKLNPAATNAQAQQKIAPGTKVTIQNSDIDHLVKLAGLK